LGPLRKPKVATSFYLHVDGSRYIPLKSVTARAVADGLVEIFSWNFQILSDQGTQLIGVLMTEVCAILRVVKIRTTPI